MHGKLLFGKIVATPDSRWKLISIHALREEGDCGVGAPGRPAPTFLSTPSARRATVGQLGERHPERISIHALREEGDRPCANAGHGNRNFYPRPPRGGRPASVGFAVAVSLFLSTPSARRATASRDVQARHLVISIHALREEGDKRLHVGETAASDFYPRPPRGGRPVHPDLRRPDSNFYPRPPRGGRQQKQRQNLYFQTNYTTFCTNLEEL